MRKSPALLLISAGLYFLGGDAESLAAPYHPAAAERLVSQGKSVPACGSNVGRLWADLHTPRRPAGGFLAPNMTASARGTLRIAAIPVQFQTDASSATTGVGQFASDGHGDSTSVGDSIELMLNRADTYYSKVSYGLLRLSYTVFDSYMVTLSSDMAAYSSSSSLLRSMVIEALRRVDTYVNFGAYDAVVIFHAGAAMQLTGSTGDITSQFFNDITAYTDTQTNDTVTHSIVMAAFGRTVGGETVTMLGTFCHEFGHALGLPDLYSTATGSGGIGDWGLMGTGNYHGRPQGDSPAWMDAWCREYLGWADTKTLDTSANKTLTRAEDDSTLYKIPANSGVGNDTEYFLLEFRAPTLTGIDSSAGEGMLIWHIDNSMGSISSNNVNNLSSVSRRRVDLEEADRSDIGSSLSSFSGAASQLWPGSADHGEFGNNSTPNSKPYSGSTARFAIKNIRLLNGQINFSIDFDDVTVDDHAFSTSADLWIMFSLPFPSEEIAFTVGDLFTELAKYAAVTYDNSRIYHWDPTISSAAEDAMFGKYERVTSSEVLQEGVGYWLKLPVSVAQDLDALEDTDDVIALSDTKVEEAEYVPLYSGWNQIGTPFDFEIACTNLIFDTGVGSQNYSGAVKTGVLRDGVFYSYVQGSGYTTSAYPTLEPGNALWLYVNVDCTMTILPYPSILPAGAGFSAPKLLSAPAYAAAAAQWDDWTLQIEVKNVRGIVDQQTFVGVKPQSASVYKAPNTPDGIWAGLKSNGQNYSSLYRTVNDRLSWRFTAASSEAGPVTLTVHNIGSVPNSVPLTLVDLSTGAAADLRLSASYTFTAKAGEFRSFDIFAGDNGIVSQTVKYPAACLVKRLLGRRADGWTASLRHLRDGLLNSRIGRHAVEFYYGIEKRCE